jgi:hypothetical protein
MRRHPLRLLGILVILLLVLPAVVSSDVPRRPREAVNEAIAPHGMGGARAFCSIVYYNLCSGWLWTYSGFVAGDQAGVMFDLPTDCSGSIDPVFITHFWWYWRYTTPGWGYTITYDLYKLDANLCKNGAPQGTLAAQDPTERWNYYIIPGQVYYSPQIALTATYDKGGLPRFVTENNNMSYQAPGACPGYSVGPIHTFFWGGTTTQYCPPQYFADNYGAVDCLMDAGIEVMEGGTEPSSWSKVKTLFR